MITFQMDADCTRTMGLSPYQDIKILISHKVTYEWVVGVHSQVIKLVAVSVVEVTYGRMRR
jgi:hypothetical protein